MREVLFEFYKPTKEELKLAWGEGIFTFDANVLLNLYRYSPTTSKKWLSIMEHLGNRVWLTHQAGCEYLENRLEVIHSQKVAYEEAKGILGAKTNEIFNELNLYKKHSTIPIDEIKEEIKKSLEIVSIKIDKLSEEHPVYEPDDIILEQLTSLFKNKIGQPYGKDQLSELFKEGQQRYDNEMPPGFKDKNSKKNAPKDRLYGDFILWKQIMDKAKAEKRAIVFITDDLKEDWWDKVRGERHGPRRELLREFFNETNQRIYIYQADKFLEYANELRIGDVADEVIKEVRDIRLKNEQQLDDFNNVLIKWIEEHGKESSDSEISDLLSRELMDDGALRQYYNNLIQDQLSIEIAKNMGLDHSLYFKRLRHRKRSLIRVLRALQRKQREKRNETGANSDPGEAK